MEDLQRVCIDAYTHWMDPKDWKRPRSPHSFDCRYWIEHIAQFEDQLGVKCIRDRLTASSSQSGMSRRHCRIRISNVERFAELGSDTAS
mgnify:CR=1 FL=1